MTQILLRKYCCTVCPPVGHADYSASASATRALDHTDYTDHTDHTEHTGHTEHIDHTDHTAHTDRTEHTYQGICNLSICPKRSCRRVGIIYR